MWAQMYFIKVKQALSLYILFLSLRFLPSKRQFLFATFAKWLAHVGNVGLCNLVMSNLVMIH